MYTVFKMNIRNVSRVTGFCPRDTPHDRGGGGGANQIFFNLGGLKLSFYLGGLKT